MVTVYPKTRRVHLPSKEAIRRYWANELVLIGKFLSPDEPFEGDCCFACTLDSSNYLGPTERAHITAHGEGGPDLVENIHILCKTCHKDSEHLKGKAYWDWFMKRDAVDLMISAALMSSGGKRAVSKWIKNGLR